VSFEEILPPIVLGVLAGLHGARAGRWMLAVVPLAWLTGGLLGLDRPLLTPPVLPAIGLLLLPGVLAAWDYHLPTGFVVAVAAGLVVWTAYLNGSAMAIAGAGLLAVCGAAASATVVVTMVAALAVAQGVGWRRVALRVASSWIAALALLSIGWSLHGRL
jgi:hypothetical protein